MYVINAMAAILTEAHEYICNGEVDDVHVGDALHLLVGQHRHQHQQVPAHPHLVVLSIARTNCDSCFMITKNFVAATIIIIAVTMTIELTRKIVR